MSKRRKATLSVVATLAIVILILCITLPRWLNGENSGTVQVGNPVQDANNAVEPLVIDTLYFKTEIPAGFIEKRRIETPNSNDTLLRLSAIGGVNRQQDVGITIGTIPPEGLQAVADFNLRASQQDKYTRYKPLGIPSEAVGFENLNSPQGVAVFWPTGSHYVELALSSSGGTSVEKLNSTLQFILEHWQKK